VSSPPVWTGGLLAATIPGMPAPVAELALVDSPALPRRPGAAGRPAPIGVVIADGEALVSAGFGALLERAEDLAVLGEAADAEQAVALAREAAPPAILLMDISLPGLDGVQAVRRIAADPDLAGVRIVILTAYDSDEWMFGALRAGVSGFLLKDTGPSDLVEAIRAVASGAGVLSPALTGRLIDEFAAQPDMYRPAPDDLDELTSRETEVVALVARGMSNREIAEHLVISPATAKTHVSRALRKVAARDRTQLVTLAYETGLVVPHGSVPAPHSPPALVAA
jgi:DNA-binding NarL/FixJ family response regulator